MYFVICRYDLQTLMKRDFTVTNASGVKYKFRVCSALTDNACGNKTGAVPYHKTILCIMIACIMVK